MVETVAEVKTGPITSVDEFVPGEGLGGFLDDVDGPGSKKGKAKKKPVKVVQPPSPAEESDRSVFLVSLPKWPAAKKRGFLFLILVGVRRDSICC